MTRVARGVVGGYIYHVINRGNSKQGIFKKEQDYRVFIDLMKEAKRKFPIKIFAYCIMPNHFHLVVMPTQEEELSKYMHWTMTTHVRRYHQHYNTSGHLWQGRFKSFIIQEDNHFLTVLRYVEGNAVRAGLVNSARDWKWSSHRETIGENQPFLLDEIPMGLPKNWTSYIDEALTDKELEVIRRSVNRQSPYGSLEWQVKMSKELGLESTIRPKGRPRKEVEKKGPVPFFTNE